MPAPHFTQPSPGQSSAFRAHATADQSISATTWTKVLFDTEDYDLGGEVASSTFTAKADGIYQLTANVYFATVADGNRNILSVLVGGVEVARIFDGFSGGAGAAMVRGSCILRLTAGQAVEIHTYTANALTTANGSSLTFFEMAKIA